MSVDREHSQTVGPRAGTPMLPAAAGPGLPSSLDPVITLGAVQRYMESERVRSRRAILWTGAVFLLALLIILGVALLIGILVVRNAARAVDIADRAQTLASASQSAWHGVSNRLADLETSHLQVRDALKTWDDQRAKDAEALAANLEQIGRSVAAGTSGMAQAATAMESKLSHLENALATAQKELGAVQERYESLLAAVALPAKARETDPNLSREAAAAVSVPSNEVPEEGTAPQLAGSAGEDLDATSLTNADVFREEDIPPVKPPETPMEISVVTFPNGDRYEGQFKDGLADGWGLTTYGNGDRYEGEFKDDMKNGRGTFFFRNGDRYVGAFSNDMKNGKGSLLFQNGDKYVGDFDNDVMDGKGSLLYKNGNRYAGDFKNGLKHGNGVFSFANGDVYRGAFRDDVRNGRGTYLSRDGAKYIGEFKDGKRHGKGRYIYASGEEFSGEFKDGKKDGFGICTYPSGTVLKGVWKDDRFVKSAESP